jgi:hypothetical protein
MQIVAHEITERGTDIAWPTLKAKVGVARLVPVRPVRSRETRAGLRRIRERRQHTVGYRLPQPQIQFLQSRKQPFTRVRSAEGLTRRQDRGPSLSTKRVERADESAIISTRAG